MVGHISHGNDPIDRASDCIEWPDKSVPGRQELKLSLPIVVRALTVR